MHKRNSSFAKLLRRIVGLLTFTLLSHPAGAGAWIDRDGASWISINSSEITIVSIGGFEYFDRIFSQLEPEHALLNLCFGYESTSRKPTACIKEVHSASHSHADDKVRSITLNTREYGFFVALTEGALRAGAEIVVSIDNDEIYASYSIQRDFELSDESLTIILESDEAVALSNLHRESGGI